MKCVIGFAFNEAHTKLLVQLKKKGPAFNIGWLNPPGGKLNDLGSYWNEAAQRNVERRESPVQGMVREFREETGLASTKDDWLQFHYERHVSGSELYCYTTDKLDIMQAQSMESEPNVIVELGHTRSYEWVFPMGYVWCPGPDGVSSFSPQETTEHIAVQTMKRGGLAYNMPYMIPMALTYLRHPEHRYLEG
jgi:8-oxo-dGTP pyrophosphatase MutT (NUDIX family)